MSGMSIRARKLFEANFKDPRTIKIPVDRFEKQISENMLRVINAVREYKFEIRIVGGAVRDFIIGKEPRDIDFCTDASPIELIYIFSRNEFSMDPGGIQHGTIVVEFEDSVGESYEVTALGYSIDEKGKKISANFGRDWTEDAMKRDFTVNSLSMETDGTVYDYTGGIDDCKNQRIKMYYSPMAMIQKSPRLIMRFFKLLPVFENPEFDPEILKACIKYKETLKSLPSKWVKRMYEATMNGKYHKNATKLIEKYGFDSVIQDAIESSDAAIPDYMIEPSDDIVNAMENRRAGKNNAIK